MSRRLFTIGCVLLVGAVLVWLLWQWMVGAAVLYSAVRVLRRDTRKRRPKSSWANLGKTAALLFAAWNSRWLNPHTAKIHADTAGTCTNPDGSVDVYPFDAIPY